MTATDTRPAAASSPGAAARPTDGRPAQGDVRRTLLGLLASALGVFPLFELFTDSGWLVDVWLSMAIVIAPPVLLRRARPASAMHTWIGVALLVPWLTLTFLRAHAVLGFLPFAGAFHDLRTLLGQLHDTTADSVAPVHSTVAIRLALCAVLGLLTALVDMLAVVGRHGALAGVPLLVVFTVSGAVPRHPVAWSWFGIAAVAFLILLALDSSDDIQRWGHFVQRSQKAGRGRASGAFSGYRIAAVAIALALLVPVLIPDNSGNFLSDLFHPSQGSGQDGFGQDLNAGVGTGGIDPFAALHGELNRDKSVDLLSVRITSTDGSVGRPRGVQPFYLRTNVLSTFAGDGWRPGPEGRSEPADGSGYGSELGPSSQSVARYTAEITISGLRSNPPVFTAPTSISGLGANTSWSPRNMLLVDSTVGSDQVIREQVAQPEPTVRELRAAAGSQEDPRLAPWLQLPAIAPYVRSLTARITRQAATPYDRAHAISNFFADPGNGFTYSLQTATGDSGDALTDFLQKRIGYCQQYAASMGVMLRLAGVPARLVLGYAHHTPVDGTFDVNTFDAHAWVEAWFAGVGWVPFDPTPLAGITGGLANDLPWAPHRSDAPAGSDAVPTRRPTRPVPLPVTRAPVQPGPVARQAPGAGLTLPLTLLLIVVVVLGLALLPAAVRTGRRRHRLRRIRDGDTDALWAELSDTARDLGYVWSEARSPRQVARWLGSSSDVASAPLRSLTEAVESARYRPAATAVGGSELVSELETVRQGLGARRSPRERLRAFLWPASLDWSRVPVLGRWLPGGAAARRH